MDNKNKFSVISIVVVLMFVSVLLFAVPAFATHTSTVTVDPDEIKCDVSQTYTVTVTHTGGADDIREFRIYNNYRNVWSSFDCGAPPTGWTLVDQTGNYGYCQYETNTDKITSGNSETFTFDATMDTESNYGWKFMTLDDKEEPQGDAYYNYPTITNDCTEPDTDKSFSPEGTYKIEEIRGHIVEWIDSATLITLTARDDVGDHDSGIDETWYMNILAEDAVRELELEVDPEKPCWEPDFCDIVLTKIKNNIDHSYFDGKWQLYGGPFQKDEESCHVLVYYSVDNLGNKEDIKTNCFFVDKTAPEVEKVVNEPKVEELDLEMLNDGKAAWVTSESYSGDSSAKLVIPDNAAGIDFAGVDSFFDVFVQLDSITSLSYYRKVVQYDNGWSPIVIFGVDADGDGVFEAQPLEWEESLSAGSVNPSLLGDDSFIQCEATTGLSGIDTDFVQVDAYKDFKCYTPNVAGDGYEGVYEPLSYFQNNDVGRVETDDGVAMVKVELGGNIATQENEIAYVDEVELNGNTIIDEPVGFTWVTPDSDIDFTCTDQEPHPSRGEELCFKVSYDLDADGYNTDEYCSKYDGQMNEDDYCCVPASPEDNFVFNFNEKEDSFHDLEYYCKDAVEKKGSTYIQYYKVDTVPPVITKTMIGTDHSGDCPPDPEPSDDVCYVRDYGQNGVRIEVEDDETYGHAVGGVECNYKLWWEGQLIDSGLFSDYSDYQEIIFTKDSTHTLIIHCEDALGNSIDDEEVFLVDSTPPVTTKEYGEPYFEGYFPKYCDEHDGDDGHECGWAEWISTQTPITLSAWDEKVGVDKIYWRNLLVQNSEKAHYICGNLGGDGFDSYCRPEFYSQYVLNPEEQFQEYIEPFYKGEESCHVIEYYSVDKLGNEEPFKWQCVFVDDTAPEVSKEIGEPLVVKGEDNYISQETDITLSCWDIEPHPVDHVSLWYRFRVADDCADLDQAQWTDWIDPNGYVVKKTIYFEEDSCHELEYYCKDGLGNAGQVYSEIDIVDTQAPIITKEVIGPQYGDCPPVNQDDVCYIDGVTEIHVSASDPTPHPVNEVTCDWSYSVVGTGITGGKQGVTPPFNINFPEESTHELTITCEDALGNSITDEEIFIVDKTPPVTKKWYEGPKYSDELVEYSFHETLDIEGSDHDLEVTVGEDGDWMVWTFDFPVEEFTGDGNLNVGLIIATDGEGEGPAFQIHNNDGTDGTYDWGTWLMSPWGPTISDGWFGWHSGDTNTPVTDLDWVEAIGNRNTPHEDGVMEIKIKKSKIGGSFHWAASPTVGSGFSGVYDVTMQIPTAFSWSTPIVDMTIPNYVYAEYIEKYPLWITSDTLIYLIPSDAGPHKSGIKATYWRNTLLEEDEYCWNQELCQEAEGSGDWNLYGGPFTKDKESCHLIEYYSIDNVEKTEEVKKQCVFVDNQAPEPDKDVLEPKEPWDGEDSVFYPEETAHCWDQTADQIECWRVTMDTPITLDCEDPQPHPVEQETTCFNVEVDGEDRTEEYCTKVGGEMNEIDGYCCGKNAPYEFNFLEETEHNLKYYCVDALGNKGEQIDEEKFKVIGKMFEIQLNKKWNLISFPFDPIENDVETVFDEGDVPSVEAVWTYDGETNHWSVYRSDGVGTNDLEKVETGLGYWVLSNCEDPQGDDDVCDYLLIGGSLYNAGPITPPNRELVEGWNLIGYYGTEGLQEYDGPEGNGKPAYCALYSIVKTNLVPKWSSLLTYWEPYNHDWDPFTSVWQEYGIIRDSVLDPGAGYWIHMKEEGDYAPSTACPGILPPV